MNAERRPFVILRHAREGEVHWDLALDLGQALATWQLWSDPATLAVDPEAEDTVIVARRIGEHRRIYLEYEGPISGNRGSVTRVERGEWMPVDLSAELWVIALRGGWLRGNFALQMVEAGTQEWAFRRYQC